MKKEITEVQIKQIMEVLMELNIQVKAYASIQKLFESLPVIKPEEK